MLASDRSITFAPGDGVLVLRGSLAADGTLHAEYEATGAGHKPFPLKFDGTLSTSGVNGTFSSPICRAHVELHSPKPIPPMLFAPGNILGIGNP
jgi:hypothetical protein